MVKESKGINKTSAHYKGVLISMLGKVKLVSKVVQEGSHDLARGVSIQLMKADGVTARRCPWPLSAAEKLPWVPARPNQCIHPKVQLVQSRTSAKQLLSTFYVNNTPPLRHHTHSILSSNLTYAPFFVHFRVVAHHFDIRHTHLRSSRREFIICLPILKTVTSDDANFHPFRLAIL